MAEQTTTTESPGVFQSFVHALAAVTTNCSDFSAAWEGIGDDDFDMTRWEGEWRSEANGHHGPLRCVLKEVGQGTVKAFFRAKYSKILRVCYSVDLRIQEAANASAARGLEGETDLGQLAGGVYSYKGQIAEGRFVCAYNSRYDHGTFEMRKIGRA